jgi:signal transduction histidine kinase
VTRSEAIFAETRDQTHRSTDRMFLWLLVAQWMLAIALALGLTPYSWTGPERSIHVHVKLAVGFGAALNALPILLIVVRPGWWGTRHAIAAVQMIWSAMLIMITGGRIETHFHVFGSLAFLAFYRDWKVLTTATLAVMIDHLARGLLWPDSVYGMANPEWWRFLEHGGWVMFEDVVLLLGCARSLRDVRAVAEREATNTAIEDVVETRTSELREALDRYRALVENTAAIPWEYDPAARRMLYIAPQAVHLFDCELADLSDPAFLSRIVHPDDVRRVIAEIDQFVAGGCHSGQALDYRLITKSGRTAYVRTFLSSTDGHIVRGVTLDLTMQRQLELELQQSQKLESVGRLAAGVAHEINTPVQFVSDSVQFVRDGVAELSSVVDLHQQLTSSVLAGGPSQELARKVAAADAEIDLGYLFQEFPTALDRALDGLDRVAQIVRSMKSFARQDGGLITTVDLNAAVEATLTIARNEYRYVADVETDLGPLPPVSCYAGEINQVILNLVVNAAHAIAERNGAGAERGTIAISTRVAGDSAVISIRDTGNGIPAEIRHRIFDPFFTTKPMGEGTGQGLAISRAVVVDKHHGTLTFDTELGRGTTFHIHIPLTQPDTPDVSRSQQDQAA